LLQDNNALDTEFCIMDDDFKKAVTAANGFEWKNDQPAEKTPKVHRGHALMNSVPSVSQT
jgi:hypothetical protein